MDGLAVELLGDQGGVGAAQLHQTPEGGQQDGGDLVEWGVLGLAAAAGAAGAWAAAGAVAEANGSETPSPSAGLWFWQLASSRSASRERTMKRLGILILSTVAVYDMSGTAFRSYRRRSLI